MLLTWLDRITDWNPQLIRELKGRFKLRSALMAIALSIILQLLVVGFFYSRLSEFFELNFNDDYIRWNRYCSYNATPPPPDYYDNCLRDAMGYILINWQAWWLDIFRTLNWILSFAWITLGVYFLATDLEQEERRGTLNFLRLSPQSAHHIFLGKLLGVPILVYLGGLLAIPLHSIAASRAGAPSSFIVSFYILLLAGCYFTYSLALLFGFIGKSLARQTETQLGAGLIILIVCVISFIFVPCYTVWNSYTSWGTVVQSDYIYEYGNSEVVNWFALSLHSNPWLAHSFTLGILAISTYFIWRALQRCFHNPGATLFSKPLSYGLVAFCEIVLLGFCFSDLTIKSYTFYSDTLGLISGVNLILFLLVIVGLSNQRQTLLDWARYRHMTPETKQLAGTIVSSKPSSRWHDLIWGEKSPAVEAIALNLVIALLILLPAIFLKLDSESRMPALIGTIVTMNSIALYGAIAQLILLAKTPKHVSWAIGIVGLLFLVPLSAGALLYDALPIARNLLLFTPFPWILLEESVPSGLYYGEILVQWLMLVLVNIRLTHQLRQLGESATKQLLTTGQR